MIGPVLAKSSKSSPPSFPTGVFELAHAKKAKLFSAIEGNALKKVLPTKNFQPTPKLQENEMGAENSDSAGFERSARQGWGTFRIEVGHRFDIQSSIFCPAEQGAIKREFTLQFSGDAKQKSGGIAGGKFGTHTSLDGKVASHVGAW